MSWLNRLKEERILIQTIGGHNKFWAAYMDENNTAHVRWGRIGTKGMSQTKTFSTPYQAAHFINKKFDEKYRKGYTDKIDGAIIDRAKLEELAIEAAIVGTQNKCDGMAWVEITRTDPVTYLKIDEDRLYEPDCTPALLVNITTRQSFDGQFNFNLLFTGEDVMLATSKNSGLATQKIEKSHPLYDLTTKVEQAIGRRLS